MSLYKGKDIDPELLAAYFDGEFEGRDDTASLRRQVEAWLAANPDARSHLADYRRLRQIWQQTTPAEPRSQIWEKVIARVRQDMGQDRGRPRRRQGLPWLWLASAAAAACIAPRLVYLAAVNASAQVGSPR